jgi:predicted nucleotidyltransferase component of viral defense system
MKARRPPGFDEALQTLEVIPALKEAGILAGATALYTEHLENPHERFSFDLDFQVARGSVEAAHRRLKLAGLKAFRLVSRLNEDIYEYEAKVGRRVIRVEIAKPYLEHRRKYVVSRKVPGLHVLSLSDLLFAKVSAFSTRSLPRDLFDLFSVDQQRGIDWRKLLEQAARMDDNDYNPAEFHSNLNRHAAECSSAAYWRDMPVRKPPAVEAFAGFVTRLREVNDQVIRSTLEA